MTRKFRHNSMQRRDRRGVVVGLLLVSLVFLTGFAALAVNIARLQHVQTQLRASCRAAALAGAAELLDQGCLYGTPMQDDDVWAAREAARFYAARNPIDGRPLQLGLNEDNDPQGDLVVGWIDPAGPVGQVLQRPTAEYPCAVNTLRVTAHMSRNVADSLTLWFGGLVGLSSFDVAARAQATIDQRIVGFRPEPNVKVPLAPVAADYHAWHAAVGQSADPETNDLYAVNPLTGAVTAGADGIAEFTLICGQAAPSTAGEAESTETETTAGDESDADQNDADSATIVPCAPLGLYNELNIPYVWPVRCREGLSAADLRDYGGELVIRGGACPAYVEREMPEELPYGLMDVVGQPRAWALGEPGETDGNVNIVGFGAARIVAIRPVENSQHNAWEIVVQPTTLVCSQAVAARDAYPNPWIAKLELTQ